VNDMLTGERDEKSIKVASASKEKGKGKERDPREKKSASLSQALFLAQSPEKI